MLALRTVTADWFEAGIYAQCSAGQGDAGDQGDRRRSVIVMPLIGEESQPVLQVGLAATMIVTVEFVVSAPSNALSCST